MPLGIERLPTGIEAFDRILDGGLAVGGAYIVQGPPGAGKTILANQIAFHQAGQGKRVIYLTLLSESHHRMLAHLAPMSFYDESVLADCLTYVSGFPELSENGTAGLMKLVRDEHRLRGAELIVLDGLFVVEDTLASEQAFRIFVHQLQGLAHMTGCTMLLLTNGDRKRSSPEYTMVDGWIELTDDEHEVRAIRSLRVHKFRGSGFVPGRHMYRIGTKGIELYERLEALIGREPYEAPAIEGHVTTGIAGLDHMMRGGMAPATALLLAGPSGTGKTLAGLQFIAASSSEAPGLFFGFYESPTQLRASAASIGIDLAGLEEAGAVSIEWRSPAELLIDKAAHELLEIVRERGVKRLVVDGLGGFQQNLVHADRWAQFMTALGNVLQGMGVTIFYTVASPDGQDVYRAAGVPDISPLVENVVTLRRVERNETVQRLVSIVKVRDREHDLRLTAYTITDKGLVLSA
jgi:circadian clock protein KaiC